MVKKISAVVLALVLCLSVVVMPASAAGFAEDYTLPDGARIAFKVELDKEYYSAGDIATISVYAYADDALEYGAGAISIGINTAIFNTTDNTKTTIKESSTSNDAYNSYYKSAQTATWSIAGSQANTNMKKIYNNNTAEENAMYDAYVKLTIARNMSGDHENAAELNRGIYGSDINGDSAPFFTFQLKVADTVAAGTPVNVGIPSGSYAAVAAQTYINVFEDPGNATTATKTNADTTDTAALKTQATIGQAETTIVNPLKGQMRYNSEANTYDVRALAVISGDDFTETFTDDASAKTMIKEIGFVFAAGSNVASPDMAGVKALVENGTALSGYTKKTVNYLSTSISSGNYVFSCIVPDISDADAQSNSLIAVGYVAWDSDADGVVDSYNYYPAAQTISFNALYNSANRPA